MRSQPFRCHKSKQRLLLPVNFCARRRTFCFAVMCNHCIRGATIRKSKVTDLFYGGHCCLALTHRKEMPYWGYPEGSGSSRRVIQAEFVHSVIASSCCSRVRLISKNHFSSQLAQIFTSALPGIAPPNISANASSIASRIAPGSHTVSCSQQSKINSSCTVATR